VSAPNLILASASPRRRELLARLGIEPVRVVHADIDETPRKSELPRDYAQRMAREKAAVAADSGAHVLAGDTVVAVGRRILLKAEDDSTARQCLELLSGRRHRVVSAVALLAPDGILRERLSETQVRFKNLSSEEIAAYLAGGEWHGKAGGYAIQGSAEGLIAWISGSHSGVVGLPLFETRALLVEGEEVLAARLHWPGNLAAGQIEDAVLTRFDPTRRRGTARFASGEEALVDRLPASSREGAQVRLEVARAAIAERGRLKHAQARPSEEPPRPAPSLAETLAGDVVRRFPAGMWEDIWAEAWAGEVAFPSGSLVFSATPAMMLVDIDGAAPPAILAREAVVPLARAVRRFDLGGSIGIDFPSLERKDDRRAVDAALDESLAGWPHERTAMNGFGFVQLVARLERPSLLHRLSLSPAGAAARMLLRRAEQVEQPGALLLTAHPAVTAKLSDDWRAQLARRTGREVRLAGDPGLALDGGFAQAVAR
jgi:MAF protein